MRSILKPIRDDRNDHPGLFFALRQSGNRGHIKNNCDGRPMTLRRRVSPVLRFGRLVDLDQQRTLILDAELCAAVF